MGQYPIRKSGIISQYMHRENKDEYSSNRGISEQSILPGVVSMGSIYEQKLLCSNYITSSDWRQKKKINSGNTSFVGERLVSPEISSHIISVT